jgi:hypothetical protein
VVPPSFDCMTLRRRERIRSEIWLARDRDVIVDYKQGGQVKPLSGHGFSADAIQAAEIYHIFTGQRWTQHYMSPTEYVGAGADTSLIWGLNARFHH